MPTYKFLSFDELEANVAKHIYPLTEKFKAEKKHEAQRFVQIRTIKNVFDRIKSLPLISKHVLDLKVIEELNRIENDLENINSAIAALKDSKDENRDKVNSAYRVSKVRLLYFQNVLVGFQSKLMTVSDEPETFRSWFESEMKALVAQNDFKDFLSNIMQHYFMSEQERAQVGTGILLKIWQEIAKPYKFLSPKPKKGWLYNTGSDLYGEIEASLGFTETNAMSEQEIHDTLAALHARDVQIQSYAVFDEMKTRFTPEHPPELKHVTTRKSTFLFFNNESKAVDSRDPKIIERPPTAEESRRYQEHAPELADVRVIEPEAAGCALTL